MWISYGRAYAFYVEGNVHFWGNLYVFHTKEYVDFIWKCICISCRRTCIFGVIHVFYMEEHVNFMAQACSLVYRGEDFSVPLYIAVTLSFRKKKTM